jgi:formylglycine-generating enzyme required for sulfatase activity
MGFVLCSCGIEVGVNREVIRRRSADFADYADELICEICEICGSSLGVNIAGARIMAGDFDPYHAWLGIAPKDQPPHHYRLLGIDPFEASAEVIEHAADQRMAHLRTFQTGKHGPLSQRLLNEVAAAKVVLLNPAKKLAYDAELRARLETPADSSEDSFGRRMASLVAEVQAADDADRKQSSSKPLLLVGGLVVLLVAGVTAWGLSTRKASVAPQATPPSSPVAAAPVPKPEPAGEVQPQPKPIVESPKPKPAERPAKVVFTEPAAPPEPPASVPPPKPVTAPPSTPQSPIPNPQSLPSNPPSPSSAFPIPTSEFKKLPVPEGPRIDEALRVAREAYQEEYAQAQTPVARRVLANKILQKGQETKDDPVARFVLLRLARDVALKAEDNALAWQAIDRLAEGYELDPWAMKAEIVVAGAKQARKLPEHKAAADQALIVLRGALDADACAVAQEMAKLALAEAGKARERDLVAQARAGQKQAQQAAKSLEQIEAQRAKLKYAPDDPAANLAVGRYECFMKGDWAKGLAHLAKSGDPAYSTLAAEDLKAPEQDAARLKLADAWWDLAQKAEARERESMLLRAGYWYEQLGSIDDALTRTKVENRQAQIAKLGRALGGPAPKQTTTNSIGMRFVLIPAGEFLMGATPEENAWAMEEEKKRNVSPWFLDRISNELPQHPVRLSRPYYLGTYEVTQSEYEQVMGVNPSSYSARGQDAARVVGQDTSRFPVNGVGWDDAMEFCRRLAALPKEVAARRMYRLPTEAEWEYACRARSTGKWCCGDDPTAIHEYAWLQETSRGRTHPVGEKKPNAFGVYDMHGNVWEWCSDRLGRDYYRRSPAVDPIGPAKGGEHILRGGAWPNIPSYCRSAFRSYSGPTDHGPGHGFRVVLVRN